MISAVVFDLDGTILDNEGKWEEVFRQVARENGIRVQTKHWLHEPGIGITPNWKRWVSSSERAAQLSRQTWKLYGGELNLRPGVVELVEAVKERGWQTALATSSEWHTVEAELEQLDLYLAFDVTTTGEEVSALKPDPEIYLLTVQKLGADPQECVVIEDSVAGVQAAAAAGTLVVGMSSGYASPVQLQLAGAKLVIDNLTEVIAALADIQDHD